MAIIGSTGSIGRQALDVIDLLEDEFKVVVLTANKNVELLSRQAEKYKPELLVLASEEKNDILKRTVKNSGALIKVGKEALNEAAAWPSADIVLISVVGFSGFSPALTALKAGKRVALANKESLIVGGEIISAAVPGFREQIIPVDSEHSAVFQCLKGEENKEVKRIILTASGGPFRAIKKKELEKVTAKEALRHPNWVMGAKITIDSATMMNKGFEVLEAAWLFNIPLEKIDVVIHPQSIVHSLVEFCDGSLIAQLSSPDMRLPIQYAFTYPERRESRCTPVDLTKQPLLFEEPDREAFPCLEYAYKAGEKGGTMPACLNAANEVAVELFLREKISFNGIPAVIKNVMDNHINILQPSVEDIIEADRSAREEAANIALSSYKKIMF